jgi:hypothetical protein
MSLRIVVQYLPVDAKVHCTAILLSQRELVFKILDHIYIFAYHIVQPEVVLLL